MWISQMEKIMALMFAYSKIIKAMKQRLFKYIATTYSARTVYGTYTSNAVADAAAINVVHRWPNKYYTTALTGGGCVWCTGTYWNLWNAAVTSQPAAASQYNYTMTVKTVYDPSPKGFCVPPSNGFNRFSSSKYSYGHGWYCRANSSSSSATIFIPNIGWRSYQAGEYIPDSNSNYWTSGPANQYGSACNLHIVQNNVLEPLNAVQPFAYGFSVMSVEE